MTFTLEDEGASVMASITDNLVMTREDINGESEATYVVVAGNSSSIKFEDAND